MASSRHSLRVLILRWLFPALGAMTLVVAVAWPTISEYRIRERSEHSVTRLRVESVALSAPKKGQPMQLQVTKPEYTGRDDEGRPYSVSAARVIQDGLQPGTAKMTLESPTARLLLDKQTDAHMGLSATSGFYDNAARTLQLDGNVKLTHTDGYVVNMENVFVDLGKGYVQSTQPVTGQGPAGQLSGESLEVFDKGAHIILHGHSKIVLLPKKSG